jgi:transaldolase/glucose-6-phosphate isomerase
LEVSPHLALDTQATINEAVRLWNAVARPNVMIKVPGTSEGLPAIEYLLGQGINVNITLLFSVQVYMQVAKAYIKGVSKFVADGGNPQKIASVASFFVSRIDTLVDRLLDEKIAEARHSDKRKSLEQLIGKTAIANAKMAYKAYEEIFTTTEFRTLRDKGVRVQRLLWASTGTKNPRYPDTYYVDNLIGRDTVNTMPEATFVAFRDHGRVRSTIQENLSDARDTLTQLAEAGISLEDTAEILLKDGTKLFVDAYDQLLVVIGQKRQSLLGSTLDRDDYSMGPLQQEGDRHLNHLGK